MQLDELTVSEVDDESIGKKAGMKEGDVILKVDGNAVADRQAFVRALAAGGPKKVVTVRRDGKEVELTLTFESARGAGKE